MRLAMGRASFLGAVLRGTLLSCLIATASCRSRSPEDVGCEGDACDSSSDEDSLMGTGGRGGDAVSGRGGDEGGRGGSAGASGAAGTGEAGGVGGAGAGGSAGQSGLAGAGAGGDGSYCDVNGVLYQTGDLFSIACNQCVCASGEVTCTQLDCEDPPVSPCELDECRVGEVCYSNGGQNILAPDGCNHCTCDHGALYCTREPSCETGFCDFPDCELSGACYPSGAEGIPLDGCNTCTCTAGDLTCTTDETCERFDEPPCDAGSCEVDGVCYPSESTTVDGCCQCQESVLTCSDATWCQEGDPIGARCMTDGDCEPGLECIGELAGERQLCIRECGYGCPTGTVCADGIPGYNGGIIDDICMRPCNVAADCEPFGAVCNQPAGADRRYCF
jgi:hypothetical protein